MGGFLHCHPWQLTLIDPPTEKSLFDCITATDRPCRFRTSSTSNHRAPAPTRTIPSAPSNRTWRKGSMSMTMPSLAMACPPRLCRAPAIETGTFAAAARRTRARSCSSAAAGSDGTGHTSRTEVASRRLASSMEPAGGGCRSSTSRRLTRARWKTGRPTRRASPASTASATRRARRRRPGVTPAPCHTRARSSDSSFGARAGCAGYSIVNCISSTGMKWLSIRP